MNLLERMAAEIEEAWEMLLDARRAEKEFETYAWEAEAAEYLGIQDDESGVVLSLPA